MPNLLPTLALIGLLLPLAAAGAPAPAGVVLATPVEGAPDSIADAVAVQLVARSAELPGEIEIAVLGRPDDTPLAAGEELRIGAPAGRWPRARVAVPVEHWRDGRRVRSRTVWVAAHWWRDVDVHVEAAAAGTGAETLAIERRRVDVAGVSGELHDPAASLAGLRLRRPVRAGRPLLADDFEPLPDVVRGASVQVEVARGPILLHTTGRALGDASVGESLAVALDAGREPVQTLVISPQAVRVED